MAATPNTSRAILGAALAFALAACGSTAPPPSGGANASIGFGTAEATVAPASVSATSQADGVLVTLALSSDRVRAGDPVRIRISALNAGLGPVTYMSGGCGPIGGVAVSGPPIAEQPVAVPPAGDGWEAALALAKWSAQSQGGPQLDWIRPGTVADDIAIGCPANLAYEEISPGGSFTDEGRWIAQTVEGVPAQAGAYRVRLDFPYEGRFAKEAMPQDGRAHPPISVELPLAVEAGDAVNVSSTAAIDAAIADPRVRAWAAASLTRQNLGGAEINLTDDGWRFRIHYLEGRETLVFVDPLTGAVTNVQLGQ